MTPDERCEWLQWRTSGIGGSDVGKILGVSPYGDQWDVYESKRRSPDESSTSPAMTRGQRLEPAIVAWALAELGGGTLHEDQRWERDWMLATPDAIATLADGRIVGIEAKTHRRREEHEAAAASEEAQCRWYMAVTDVEVWYLATFLLGSDTWLLERLDRDLGVEEGMIARVSRWHQHHMVLDHPPEISGSRSATSWLRERHAKPGAQKRRATSEEGVLLHRRLRLSERLDALKSELAEIDNKIRAAIGDDAGLMGETASATWSRWVQSTIDWTAVRQARPEIEETIEQCTRMVDRQRLTVR